MTMWLLAAALILMVFPSSAVAQSKASLSPAHRGETSKPLVLASQGSFFVGVESKTSTELDANTTGPLAFGPGDITVNQMYVQYQTPVNGSQHVPVVMVHGCCLSSKTWETTPDGRMG